MTLSQIDKNLKELRKTIESKLARDTREEILMNLTYNIAGLSKLSGIPREQIRKLIRSGKLEAAKIGGKFYVSGRQFWRSFNKQAKSTIEIFAENDNNRATYRDKKTARKAGE